VSGPFIFIATNRLKPGKLGDSMAFHMEVVAERAAAAYAETVEATTGIEVFGAPSDAVLEMLRRQAGAGVPLRVKPLHLGGFVRP